jgi:ubiquinone biosynthesis protein COQ4
MEAPQARYSGEPTRNPFRYALAAWRLLLRDPETTTAEAGIVEIGFARSRRGRRFARWEETIEKLRCHSQTRAALDARLAFGPIDLAVLGSLPEGTLGRVFADHCKARGIDPNLVHIPPDDEIGWMLNHLYSTHDIWHVVTGWGNDLPGEVGLGAFYSAQLGAPAFFGYMSAIIFLNVVWRRADLGQVFAALSAGWRTGQHCAPMFGIAWDELWGVPLVEIRSRFEVDRSEIVGEGIRVAA